MLSILQRKVFLTDFSKSALSRRDVVQEILCRRGDALVVAGLGSSAWDCAAVSDCALDFLLWGAMGSAAAIGLGLAQAQPNRRVLVITGDGEIVMGLGSLASIGGARVGNFALIVLDNEHYGETGMQPSHTSGLLDLVGLARSCGFTQAQEVTDINLLQQSIPIIYDEPGPIAINIKVKAEEISRVLPPRDGVYLKNRFRSALGVEEV